MSENAATAKKWHVFDVLNSMVLTLTLIALVFYTHYTRILTEEAQRTNLTAIRPVILRRSNTRYRDITEIDQKWSVLKPPTGGYSEFNLFFELLKNIATNIQGYAVIDGFKYPFHLSLASIDTVSDPKNPLLHKATVDAHGDSPFWSWLPPENSLAARLSDSDKEPAKGPNQIFISYSDVEGREYVTIEDEKFVPRSFLKSEATKTGAE